MLLRIAQFFQPSWNLYLSDFLDIIITALFLYSLFLLLRKTKSYRVFIGIIITVGLYAVARTLNLYLTWLILQYFVSVSLIILVIIFQKELRKYFEFLGIIGARQIKAATLASKSPTINEIVQACVKMAQAKVGALIVIQGKDDLDSFLEGGIELDGVISEEVLLSIFDPHSEGHDGALVISNNRIAKFGTHLPLSTNFKEIGKHGTRHSAGLGLVENSDAFCIIVSEENGKISISKDGKLKPLTEFTDLEKELEKYVKAKFNPKPRSLFYNVVHHNFGLKVATVLATTIIWFFTAYQAGIIEKTYNVPITFNNVAKDILVEEYNPKEIKVTVSGRGNSVFADIATTDFKVIYDAKNLANGVNKFQLQKGDVEIPHNLTLVSYEPDSFLISAKKFTTVKVPIKVETRGTLQNGVELKSVAVTPDVISVNVMEGVNIPTELSTEMIDISQLDESTIIPSRLVLSEGFNIKSGDDKVNVALTIEKTTNQSNQ